MSLNNSEAKRQRRVRRQTHRRSATKEEVALRFGEKSGIRKHVGTTLNPLTKRNKSTETRRRVKSGKLGKFFKEAFAAAKKRR